MLQLKSLLIYCRLSISGDMIQVKVEQILLLILLSTVWKDLLYQTQFTCSPICSIRSKSCLLQKRSYNTKVTATVQREHEGLPIPRHQRRHIDYDSNWLTHAGAGGSLFLQHQLCTVQHIDRHGIIPRSSWTKKQVLNQNSPKVQPRSF
jgi:hypothetical protein